MGFRGVTSSNLKLTILGFVYQFVLAHTGMILVGVKNWGIFVLFMNCNEILRHYLASSDHVMQQPQQIFSRIGCVNKAMV